MPTPPRKKRPFPPDRPDVSQLKKTFLEEYGKVGNIWYCAQKVGVDRRTILRWRKADKDFAKAVSAKHDDSTDFLKLTAYQRAIAGTSKAADSLLMFLIKQRDPTFRERGHLKDGGGTPAEQLAAIAKTLDGFVSMAITILKKECPRTCPSCRTNLDIPERIGKALLEASARFTANVGPSPKLVDAPHSSQKNEDPDAAGPKE